MCFIIKIVFFCESSLISEFDLYNVPSTHLKIRYQKWELAAFPRQTFRGEVQR